MILLIDNYDSFTYNLYNICGKYKDVRVFKNDEITIEEIEELKPEGIIISPGPGRPENAGITVEVIKRFYKTTPILGICLGHQAIGLAFGGEVIKNKEIYHGKKSKIKLLEKEILSNIPRKINVMRYHSLIVRRDNLPYNLEIISENIDDGVIMGLKVKGYKTFGLQFHPESIYTEKGEKILENFLYDICN